MIGHIGQSRLTNSSGNGFIGRLRQMVATKIAGFPLFPPDICMTISLNRSGAQKLNRNAVVPISLFNRTGVRRRTTRSGLAN